MKLLNIAIVTCSLLDLFGVLVLSYFTSDNGIRPNSITLEYEFSTSLIDLMFVGICRCIFLLGISLTICLPIDGITCLHYTSLLVVFFISFVNIPLCIAKFILYEDDNTHIYDLLLKVESILFCVLEIILLLRLWYCTIKPKPQLQIETPEKKSQQQPVIYYSQLLTSDDEEDGDEEDDDPITMTNEDIHVFFTPPEKSPSFSHLSYLRIQNR